MIGFIRASNFASMRVCRAQGKKEDIYFHVIKQEKKAFLEDGIVVPDLTDEKAVEKVKAWNGRLDECNRIPQKKVRPSSEMVLLIAPELEGLLGKSTVQSAANTTTSVPFDQSIEMNEDDFDEDDLEEGEDS